MERLTKRLSNGEVMHNCGKCQKVNEKDFCSEKNCAAVILNRLAELEDKLESGQLVEIPQLGERYWYLYSDGTTEEVVVTKIEVMVTDKTRVYAYGRILGGLVGVIMFPTYEQVETRIKELRGEAE